MSLLSTEPVHFLLSISSIYQTLFFILTLDNYVSLDLSILPPYLILSPSQLPQRKASVIPLYRYNHGWSGHKEIISRKVLFCKLYGLFHYTLAPYVCLESKLVWLLKEEEKWLKEISFIRYKYFSPEVYTRSSLFYYSENLHFYIKISYYSQCMSWLENRILLVSQLKSNSEGLFIRC